MVRSHPVAADILLALALATAAAVIAFVTPHDSDAATADAVLGVCGCLVLGWRRRAPIAVTVAVSAVATRLTVDGTLGAAVVVAALIAMYSAGANRGLARGVTAPAIGTISVLVGAAITGPADGRAVVGDVAIVAVIVATWWIGRSVRLRRAYTAELETRALRLERARDVYARAVLTEERSRIARELHDVVAHHVSVMTVQATAARRILDASPRDAKEALSAVEQTGRAALTEMRRLVGVLRTDDIADTADRDDEAANRTPQPGVDDLGRLLGQLADTGLTVDLVVHGRRRPVPAGVDLAAYRVVQEALTNTLKHAGSGAHAQVTVGYEDRRLRVEITDDGRGFAAALSRAERPGHGLVGMRERVALYGGDLTAGARAGGGYAVRALFPLEAGNLRHDTPAGAGETVGDRPHRTGAPANTGTPANTEQP